MRVADAFIQKLQDGHLEKELCKSLFAYLWEKKMADEIASAFKQEAAEFFHHVAKSTSFQLDVCEETLGRAIGQELSCAVDEISKAVVETLREPAAKIR